MQFGSSATTAIYALTNIASATTTNTTGVDVSAFEGDGILTIQYRDNAGTTPTLAIVVQESADNSNWDTAAGTTETFSAVGAADSYQALRINLSETEKYLRLSITTGGTPNYDIGAILVGTKKYA